MKHIFLVHSHTLFLTALGVIDHLRLERDEVFLVFSRNYKTAVENPYVTVDMSKEAEDCFHAILSLSRKNYTVNRPLKDRVIRAVDQFIEEFVSTTFKVYVPHLQSVIAQIFSTHHDCDSVHYIQEGGRVMNNFLTDKNFWVFDLYNRVVLRKENRLWKSICWFPPRYIHFDKIGVAYAIDPVFFGVNHSMPVERIVWPQIPTGLTIDSSRSIFVYEGAIELGQVEAEVYLSAAKRQIFEHARENNYVKFHPAQSTSHRASILGYFAEKGVGVEELPLDVPFELILASESGLNLFGFGTSLLFFGRELGHKVVSSEDDLLVSKRYSKYAKDLPRLY